MKYGMQMKPTFSINLPHVRIFMEEDVVGTWKP